MCTASGGGPLGQLSLASMSIALVGAQQLPVTAQDKPDSEP